MMDYSQVSTAALLTQIEALGGDLAAAERNCDWIRQRLTLAGEELLRRGQGTTDDRQEWQRVRLDANA